jgi:hypothetical protein
MTNDLTTKTLAQRGSVYGPYEECARIAQSLKDVMHSSPGWQTLHNEGREALDHNATKISRILTGDPSFLDNWDDIAGYATRTAQSIRERHELAAKEADGEEPEHKEGDLIPSFLTEGRK